LRNNGGSFTRLYALQPFLPAIALATVGAFDLQDGAVVDLIADARLQEARASRARRSASRRTLDAEAVRNETLRTATGTVALPILS
jgi:hypothetical protein